MAKTMRFWCFTINNPTTEDDPNNWDVRFVVWQKEKGDEETEHFQGYVEMKRGVRLSAMKKINARAHWEPRKGTQEEAIDYCEKEDTRLDGPWRKGELVTQGRRTDLIEFANDIKDNKRTFSEICQLNPDMVIKYSRNIQNLIGGLQQPYEHDTVRGEWYWGNPGTGKSHKAWTENPDAYDKAQNKWFDGYEGQKVIVLDDFDKNGKVLGTHMKRWTDKWKCRQEMKGASVQLCHEKFIVTSNYSIEDIWDDDIQMQQAIRRRFNVTHFTNTPFTFSN